MISLSYGTEQGYAHEDNRHALWASRFNQSSELYQHIRALNRVRRQQRLGLATMTLIGASDEWVVLCRGDPATAAGSAWLFANNHPASREHTPHVYCPPRLPPRLPPEGDGEWVDELSGQRARFVDGCLHAPDGRPKVLVSRMFSRQPMAASDERTRSAEHATQIISD